jgi:hypothetical protein
MQTDSKRKASLSFSPLIYSPSTKEVEETNLNLARKYIKNNNAKLLYISTSNEKFPIVEEEAGGIDPLFSKKKSDGNEAESIIPKNIVTKRVKKFENKILLTKTKNSAIKTPQSEFLPAIQIPSTQNIEDNFSLSAEIVYENNIPNPQLQNKGEGYDAKKNRNIPNFKCVRMPTCSQLNLAKFSEKCIIS